MEQLHFHGLIVFEIIESADVLVLNGTYCNNATGGKYDKAFALNNMIAKRNIIKDNSDILIGMYSLRYIDNNLVNAFMEIMISNEAYTIRIFERKKDNTEYVLFTGIGIRTAKNHFAVSYIKSLH